MTIEISATKEEDAGDRRADDTHWWKAYQLHSTVALPVKTPGTLASPAEDRGWVADERYRPTETEIHRAASKALQLKAS